MRLKAKVVLALIFAIVFEHTALPAAPRQLLQPANWDAGARLPDATDVNPILGVVEVNLEARVAAVDIGGGKVVEAWTYNGGVPGPLIRVRVGDRLVVRFSNHLPEPTTIHWHGVRVPIQMDGVPGISQPAVRPGGSFTYDFVVPDAGLYWYHPHVMSAAQVGFGLYGALLVEDPDDRVGVSDELVLVLSDMAIDRRGQIEDPESGGRAGMAFGREGNVVLVNGRTDRTLTARAGVPQRWRIVNASKTRYFNLDLEQQPFTKIGGDGGLQEFSQEFEQVLMPPGQRVDLLVAPKGRAGSTLAFRSFVYNRGYGSVEFRPPSEDLFLVTLAEPPDAPLPPRERTRRAIAPLSTANATQVAMNMTLEDQNDGSLAYGFNHVPYWQAKPFRAELGETQVWTLANKTPWSHPFHLHGFFFQVLDEHGAPAHPLEWKDTVDVPFDRTVKLVVKFDDGRPGHWMIHCHILDHAEGGLMGFVQVGPLDPNQKPPSHTH